MHASLNWSALRSIQEIWLLRGMLWVCLCIIYSIELFVWIMSLRNLIHVNTDLPCIGDQFLTIHRFILCLGWIFWRLKVARQAFTMVSRVLVSRNTRRWNLVWAIIRTNGRNALQPGGSWMCARWRTNSVNWRNYEGCTLETDRAWSKRGLSLLEGWGGCWHD